MDSDFGWLAEIREGPRALDGAETQIRPAGLHGTTRGSGFTLVVEADSLAGDKIACARGIRNGLMVSLLALCPIRLKNFASLEPGHTFKQAKGSW